MKKINREFTGRPTWLAVPPWLILGSVLVLAPLFLYMTLETLHRQRENAFRLLSEKGAALIRSFEAGTRTGMMGMGWGDPKLQRLLVETARQPDILYLMVTDDKGTILAHSDVSQIGNPALKDLDFLQAAQLQEVQWQQTTLPDGLSVFEVFRGFQPVKAFAGRHHGPGPRMRHPEEARDRPFPRLEGPQPEEDRAIFVGLDLKSIEQARQEDERHTIIMAAILLLVGFAGVFSLLLAQAYRSTRSSLSKVQAFSHQVVTHIPVGLVAVDRSGTVVSLNQAANGLLHKTPSEAVGLKADQVLPTPLCEILNKALSGEAFMESEMECCVGQDRTLAMEVMGTPLRDEKGSVTGGLLLVRDLAEIKSLKREIERNQRLASIGKLAAGVAHEIRNPLSSIKGFATYFRDRYRNVPEDVQTAEVMIKEVDRLNRVISQLLEFARPLNIHKEWVASEDLINHGLRMLRTALDAKGIQIRLSLDPSIQALFVDKDRMSQVLLNLLLNGVEAMEPFGVLTIETRQRKEDGALVLSVTDTGRGISPEDLPHVFDPYFTTRPGGTGLGLAIVHNIVKAHQGEVRVESWPGKGTSVDIYLPAKEAS